MERFAGDVMSLDPRIREDDRGLFRNGNFVIIKNKRKICTIYRTNKNPIV